MHTTFFAFRTISAIPTSSRRVFPFSVGVSILHYLRMVLLCFIFVALVLSCFALNLLSRLWLVVFLLPHFVFPCPYPVFLFVSVSACCIGPFGFLLGPTFAPFFVLTVRTRLPVVVVLIATPFTHPKSYPKLRDSDAFSTSKILSNNSR